MQLNVVLLRFDEEELDKIFLSIDVKCADKTPSKENALKRQSHNLISMFVCIRFFRFFFTLVSKIDYTV